MAVDLLAKPNVITTDPAFPLGKIKDNPGDNTGTPVNALVYSDMHIFFASMMVYAGLTYSGNLDNGFTELQYLLALQKSIRKTTATETDAGTAKIATEAETLAGTNDFHIITPAKLQYWYDQLFNQPYTADTSATNWSFGGGAGSVAFSSCNVRYKRQGTTLHVNLAVLFTVATSSVFLITYTFPGLSRAGLVQVHKGAYYFNGTVNKNTGSVTINNNSPFTITLQPDQDLTTSFAVGTTHLMQCEFTVEIN